MNKILSMLSLAKRAGKLVSGEFLVEDSIRRKKSKLVVIASDASENTKKLFKNKCMFYGVDYFIYASKEELGFSIGKFKRASLSIEDENFASKIQSLLKEC